jgi:hypothetical protein
VLPDEIPCGPTGPPTQPVNTREGISPPGGEGKPPTSAVLDTTGLNPNADRCSTTPRQLGEVYFSSLSWGLVADARNASACEHHSNPSDPHLFAHQRQPDERAKADMRGGLTR